MKIAVIGANGKAGTHVTREALSRGHEVTAFTRSGNAPAGAKGIAKDIFNLTYEDIKACDVIISAFGTWTPETIPQIIPATTHLCDILRGKQNRLLVVGGAGSLYVNPEHTVQLMDTPEFPDIFKYVAEAHGKTLAHLRTTHDVRWTYISPAADFRADGDRTGTYKIGGEELTLNSKGESTISYADYAIAMVDEAEKGNYIGKRFGVVSV